MRFALLLPFFLSIVLADDWIIRDFHRHIVYPLKDASDNLVFVTFSLDRQRAVQLDFHDGRESCVVPHDLAYNSRSRYKVAILGNGKVVVTLMNNQVRGRDIRLATQKLDWKLSIVDPRDCSYRHEVIGHYRQSFTGILPYMDAFDLEVKDNKVDQVVRYKDDGELEGFVARIPDRRYLGFRIAEEFNPSRGYYYVVPNKNDNLSVIKRLNSKFEVIKTYEIKHQKLAYDSHSYSVTFGRITFCYFNGGRTSLQCVIIDGELNRELSKTQLTYDHEMSDTTVVNLRRGGFAVVHVNVDHRGEKRMFTVYARRVGENGEVGAVVTIGKVADEMYGLYAFGMKDRRLCVVVTSRDSALTKCVSM